MICSDEKIGEACRKTAGWAERLPRRDYERWRISWLKPSSNAWRAWPGRRQNSTSSLQFTNPECGDPARQVLSLRMTMRCSKT